MKTFEENIILLNHIRNNKDRQIKDELVNTIFLLEGDEEELARAFEYVLSNSNLKEEVHIPMDTSHIHDAESLFTEEKFNFFKNFSQVRFNRLISIYKEAYMHKTYEFLPQPKSSNGCLKQASLLISGAIVAMLVTYVIIKQLLK